MINEWERLLPTKPKLRTYIKFKSEFKTEEYVCACLPRYERSLLAQFRSGILPLRIETGRFRNLKVEERICLLCNNDKIEDEYHFLCECSLFYEFRNPLFDAATRENSLFPDMSKPNQFIYLVKTLWREVSKYLRLAWEKRRNTLYNSN